jgi:hypothetical protein
VVYNARTVRPSGQCVQAIQSLAKSQEPACKRNSLEDCKWVLKAREIQTRRYYHRQRSEIKFISESSGVLIRTGNSKSLSSPFISQTPWQVSNVRKPSVVTTVASALDQVLFSISDTSGRSLLVFRLHVSWHFLIHMAACLLTTPSHLFF